MVTKSANLRISGGWWRGGAGDVAGEGTDVASLAGGRRKCHVGLQRDGHEVREVAHVGGECAAPADDMAEDVAGVALLAEPFRRG